MLNKLKRISILKDFSNLFNLLKENFYSAIIILTLTFCGFYFGQYLEDRIPDQKSMNFEIAIKQPLYIPSYSLFESILENYFSIFDSQKIDVFNKDFSPENPIYSYNNYLDFAIPTSDLILSSVDFKERFSNLNRGVRYQNDSSSANLKKFTDNEINYLKRVQIKNKEDTENHDILDIPHIVIFNFGWSEDDLVDRDLFSEKMMILIQFVMKDHINTKIEAYYNQFLSQVDFSISLIESNTAIVKKIAERKKNELVEFIDKQIDIAEMLQLNSPAESMLNVFEFDCLNYNPVTEKKFYLSRCFLYGKLYLESEKSNLNATPLEYFEPTLAENRAFLFQLYALKNDSLENKNLNKLKEFVDSNKYNLVSYPTYSYQKIQGSSPYNARFFAALFFIVSSFIFFFLGVIKYQKKNN